MKEILVTVILVIVLVILYGTAVQKLPIAELRTGSGSAFVYLFPNDE